MSTTTDPNHPQLTRGVDSAPVPQSTVYLVLSEEERARGFVRPVRHSYLHTGERPQYPTRELTDDEKARHGKDYVLYEAFPESELPKVGRFWSAEQLRAGCGAVTTMNQALAETYAREPRFYGATYCVGCGMHRPVAEFVWETDGSRVGS